MKKLISLIVVAVLAMTLACSAFAQRKYVVYGTVGPLANISAKDFGVGIAVGVRNYNRESLISFSPSIEAMGYFYPRDMVFGAFIVPELGVAFGPSGFKFYPHTGLMLGYDNQNNAFAWGGKSGFAFDFGKHFTLDISSYIPKYNFLATSIGLNLIWRF